MKNIIEVGHLAVTSGQIYFKSGYVVLQNQKQKFVTIIVLIALGIDGAEQ